MNDEFGKTYAELTPEEREIVDQRMKEKRAEAAKNSDELSEDDLEQEFGGHEFRYGEDFLSGRQK